MSYSGAGNFAFQEVSDASGIALKYIPTIGKPIITERGPATLQKTDIFKRIMWFSYEGESDWYPLPVERVNALLEMNTRGEKPAALLEEEVAAKKPERDYADVVGQAVLRDRRKDRNKHHPRNRGGRR